MSVATSRHSVLRHGIYKQTRYRIKFGMTEALDEKDL